MSKTKRNEKGQFLESGNPGGRPKGHSITKELRKYMYEIDPITGASRMEVMITMLWDKATKGDLKAINIIMNRLEGTPKQTIDTIAYTTEPIKVFDIVGEPDPDSLIEA